MKVNFRVTLKSTSGRTGAQTVTTTFDELAQDEAGTKDTMRRMAEQELNARSARNDRAETWSATDVTRA